MMSTQIFAFFQEDGKLQKIQVSLVTSERLRTRVFANDTIYSDVLRKAHAFAREKGAKKLTEELLIEYLDTLT
ncbi:MAG: hypothetical protein U9P90_01705 [Patescibacteria group bacterium]|nr:hypothetical protein [Patescibacteria group bacterium]